MRMHLLSSFLMIIVVGLACIPFIDDEKTPKAPTELEAVSITVDKVELQWKDNSDDEDGFRVFRDDQVLATTETERYTDNSVESESHYHYRVEAFNDIGARTSKTIKVSTPSDNDGGPGPSPGVPKAPTNLIAKSEFHQVTLSWKDNATNEINYVVERSGLKEKLLKNTTKYTDQNLDFNKNYSYKVYAENAVGTSDTALIDAITRGSFEVRWNRAKDRKEVNGQLVENGWASTYELIVTRESGDSFVAYSGPDTSFTVIIDESFCATVSALDDETNKSPASAEVCSQ